MATETEAASSPGAEDTGMEQEQAPASGAPANGAAVQAASPAPDEKAQAFWRGKLMTANFGGAVSLFMRSPAHRHYTLADLEWCLIPPLVLNQFMAGRRGFHRQRALALALAWVAGPTRGFRCARYPIRLHPNEWQSGEAIWIIDAVGEPKAVQQCLEMLRKTAFQGKRFKMLKAAAEIEPMLTQCEPSG